MKKALAIILALVMVLSLSVTALAVDTLDLTNTSVSTGNVIVTYTEGVNDKIVYSITVDWTDTSVEYQTEGEGTWNPLSHTYDDATEEGWTTNNTASVTVTNHSNAAVTATIAAGANETGASYSFDKNSVDLDAAAEGSAQEDADKETFTITAGGTPARGGTDIITVTVSAGPVAP